MVQLKLKELLQRKNMSRYELQKLTSLNYPRINQLYKNEAKNISFIELDILTKVLNCSISDLIDKK
mgnify:CR=1 FL=1